VVLGNEGLVCEANPVLLFFGGRTLFFLELLEYFLVHNGGRAIFFPYCCTVCAKRTGSQVSVMERTAHFERKTDVYF